MNYRRRMRVATPGKNGNATVVAQASGVPNPTGEVVRWGPEDPGWEHAAHSSDRWAYEVPW